MESYCFLDDITITSEKFFAPARISETPPISIFSIISSSLSEELTVSEKG